MPSAIVAPAADEAAIDDALAATDLVEAGDVAHVAFYVVVDDCDAVVGNHDVDVCCRAIASRFRGAWIERKDRCRSVSHVLKNGYRLPAHSRLLTICIYSS